MKPLSAPWLRGGALLSSVAAALWACNWAELDAIRPLPNMVDAQAPVLVEAAASTDAATAPDDASVEEAAASSACLGNPATINQWTFDSGTDAWTLSTDNGVVAALKWNSGIGDPSPGALEVDITPGTGDAANANGAWLEYTAALGNLTGRTVSAWVWLDSGPTPHFKLFVQTGTQWVWADNGTVLLSPHTWTCVSLPVSSPSYNGDNYDPTAVVRVGFEMLDSQPFRLYVDSVRYY